MFSRVVARLFSSEVGAEASQSPPTFYLTSYFVIRCSLPCNINPLRVFIATQLNSTQLDVELS